MDRGSLSAHEHPFLVLFAEEVLPDKELIPDKLELSLSHSSDSRPGGDFFLCRLLPPGWTPGCPIEAGGLEPELTSSSYEEALFSGDRLLPPLSPPLPSPLPVI